MIKLKTMLNGGITGILLGINPYWAAAFFIATFTIWIVYMIGYSRGETVMHHNIFTKFDEMIEGLDDLVKSM